jgi:hypothetical protein
MNIQTILLLKFPNDEWTLTGEDYEGLTWLSDTPKPTKKQLEDLSVDVAKEIEASAKAKADAKTSAKAKLAALGLTEAEIAAL